MGGGRRPPHPPPTGGSGFPFSPHEGTPASTTGEEFQGGLPGHRHERDEEREPDGDAGGWPWNWGGNGAVKRSGHVIQLEGGRRQFPGESSKMRK